MPDRMPDQLQDRMSEYVPDRMLEYMSERMPDEMPDRVLTWFGMINQCFVSLSGGDEMNHSGSCFTKDTVHYAKKLKKPCCGI